MKHAAKLGVLGACTLTLIITSCKISLRERDEKQKWIATSGFITMALMRDGSEATHISDVIEASPPELLHPPADLSRFYDLVFVAKSLPPNADRATRVCAWFAHTYDAKRVVRVVLWDGTVRTMLETEFHDSQDDYIRNVGRISLRDAIKAEKLE